MQFVTMQADRWTRTGGNIFLHKIGERTQRVMLIEAGINTILQFIIILCIGAAVSVYISRNSHSAASVTGSILNFLYPFLISVILIFAIYFLINMEFLAFHPSDPDSLLTVMTVTLTALLLQIFREVRRGRDKGRDRLFDNPLFLSLFELSMILILFFCMGSTPIMQALAQVRRYYFYFFLMFLAACLMIVLTVSQSVRRRALRKLADNRKVTRLKQAQYENMVKRRQEMNRIRGEYDQSLDEILSLIEAGRVQEAEVRLENLSDRIEATKEYPWCGIPVINAMLTEKSNQCRRDNIRFTADMLLPDKLSIQDLDLCIALGNLLDNAIHECRKSPDDTDIRPEISLVGKYRQGYLVLKCTNSFFSGNNRIPSVPEGTGYGLKILEDLAGRYDGNFYFEMSDLACTAQLSLLLNKGN